MQPKDRKTLLKAAFKPQLRELVFDIDMTDCARPCLGWGGEAGADDSSHMQTMRFGRAARTRPCASAAGASSRWLSRSSTARFKVRLSGPASRRKLTSTLADDFGFNHRLWVYSGRRGIHCWISDPAALALTDEQRRAIVNYLEVIKGGAQMNKKVNLNRPLHPSLSCVLPAATLRA